MRRCGHVDKTSPLRVYFMQFVLRTRKILRTWNARKKPKIPFLVLWDVTEGRSFVYLYLNYLKFQFTPLSYVIVMLFVASVYSRIFNLHLVGHSHSLCQQPLDPPCLQQGAGLNPRLELGSKFPVEVIKLETARDVRIQSFSSNNTKSCDRTSYLTSWSGVINPVSIVSRF
jgi:hypothetical protein